MIKKILILSITAATLGSCVSKKVFEDLESKYSRLRKENRDLSSDLAAAQKELAALKKEYSITDAQLADTALSLKDLNSEYASTKAQLEALQSSYDALEKNSSASIAENASKNRELLSELEQKRSELADKQQALDAEHDRLEQLQKDLSDRSLRITELEELIAAKDASMRALKDSVSRALTDFEGKGLTVEQRDGKVYVSLENKLLFASGSWTVGANGKTAVVALGKVLAQNPDIAVLIEGHTDDVPYSGNGNLKGNWDLSAKRATAIVNILRENGEIDPKNLTAAGRGEYAPVAPNDTAENKAKNRRIEVILTPKLDEVTALLKDVN